MSRLSRSVWTALALLAGCASPPPPVAPTIVNATIDASADTNGGAPVAVRVYQLVSSAAFNGAQFFPLFDKDAATLKDDLVKRDNLLLPPGQSRTIVLQPEDRAHVVGVFVALRDYEHATWHAVADIPAHKTSTLTVAVTKAGVSLMIEPVPLAK